MADTDNSSPPYRHWHVVCVRCRAVTLALPCMPPKSIPALDGPLTVACRGCGHEQTYLEAECFLAEARDARPARSEAGTVAVVAGLVAAVRLARVEKSGDRQRLPSGAGGHRGRGEHR